MKLHLKLGDEKAEDISEDTVKAVAETLRTSSFLKVSEDGKVILFYLYVELFNILPSSRFFFLFIQGRKLVGSQKWQSQRRL